MESRDVISTHVHRVYGSTSALRGTGNIEQTRVPGPHRPCRTHTLEAGI